MALKSISDSVRRAGAAASRVARRLFGGQPKAAGSSSSEGTGREGTVNCPGAVTSVTDCQGSEAVEVANRAPSPSTPAYGAGVQNGHAHAHAHAQPTDSNNTATVTSKADKTLQRDDNTMDVNVAAAAAFANGFPVKQWPQQHRARDVHGKENVPPGTVNDNFDALIVSTDKLSLEDTQHDDTPEVKSFPSVAEEVVVLSPEQEAYQAERARHLVFIEEALDMARLALKINETPVGCVLVHEDKIIAKGMNATNVTRNGTRHAEFMAISALLSEHPRDGRNRTTCLRPKTSPKPPTDESTTDDCSSTCSPQPLTQPDEGNEDGRKGHLYPYGQKTHPDIRVDRAVLAESTLYVTVEPCIMCASLLRQLGIKKVFFGAVNDKFGGTGGVFSIHANSLPVREDGQTASAHPQPPPVRLPDGGQVLGTSFPPGGGDGGNVEAGFEIEGGWGRDDAVGLLRRFYVQENGRAPVPRKKEGRAARLAAIMDGQDTASNNSGSAGGTTGLPDGDDMELPIESPAVVDKDHDRGDGDGVGYDGRAGRPSE